MWLPQSWHWGQTLLFEQSGQEAGRHAPCQAEGKAGKKHDEVRSRVGRDGVQDSQENLAEEVT